MTRHSDDYWDGFNDGVNTAREQGHEVVREKADKFLTAIQHDKKLYAAVMNSDLWFFLLELAEERHHRQAANRSIYYGGE